MVAADSSEGGALLVVSDDQRAALRRLDRLASLMDDAFEVPLLKVRLGLDPLIGLIPGGGDWVVAIVSLYIFWEGVRLGARPRTLGKMAMHIAADLLTGYVPGIGDALDVVYKANRKNVDLLREELRALPSPGGELVAAPGAEGQALSRASSPALRYTVAALVTAALLGLAAGPWVLLYYLLHT